MLYLAEQDKIPATTWSGATHSLYVNLNSLISTTFIPLRYRWTDRLTSTAVNIILNHRLETNLNFNELYQSHRERKIQTLLGVYSQGTATQPVIQIGDLADIPGSSIYTDLSISYLLYCKRHYNTSFRVSGFQKFSDATLQTRNNIQLRRYKSARYILTMSHMLHDFLIDEEGFSDEKVKYVGGGSNVLAQDKLSVSKIRPAKQRTRVLFVGKDFSRKGGDRVIRAFNILKHSHQEIELYIAGPSKQQFPDTKGVHFLGERDLDSIEKLYQACDIFCMPSRFEAFGLVFVEALSHGLPCIGMDRFEMKNLIKDGFNGKLIRENDSDTVLAEKMWELLKDNRIFENVAQMQSYYLKNYSWHHVANNIVKIVGDNK